MKYSPIERLIINLAAALVLLAPVILAYILTK